MKNLSAIILIIILAIIFGVVSYYISIKLSIKPSIKGLTLDELIKKCPQGTDPDTTCLEEETRKMVREGRVIEAFDLIEARYKAAAGGSASCHALTHIIGEETYSLFAKEVDFDVSPKSAYCAYGFYHGFMERLVSKTKDLRQASEFCAMVDQKLASIAADTQLQCYHGIGHGTATAHDPRVEGDEWAILTPALKLCERVSETADQLYRCTSGAFNAIALYYMDGEYNLPLNKNDPLRLCREQEDRFKDSCYGNMNTLLSWMFNDDLAKSAPFIEEIPEDNYAISAINYLSAIIASRNVDKTDRLVNLCRSLQKRLRLSCVVGIVHGIIEHGKPGIEYIEALKFCKSPTLNEDERIACFDQAVGFFYSIYPKEKVAEICTGIEQRYSDHCKKGN